MPREVALTLRRLLLTIVLSAVVLAGVSAQAPPDRCLVPAGVRDPILMEVSGELAHQHVQMLTPNRNRQPDEYENQFFETTYISEMARQFGLSNVQVHFFPGGRETWDAEEADLWMIEPARKKIASLTMVPAALASGSRSADVEAEVVYIGAGREADFAGKDVKGKIVLGSGSVSAAFNAGMARDAVGALGTGSSAVNSNSPGYSLDQIGWASVSARPETGGFGFNLSLRQYHELRTLFDRGQKVVMKARVRTRTYPGKMNVVSASIPGSDPAAGELMIVAHAFETIATPGGNDNCTGVGTTLEIGRTLARLIREGELPPPRRTIRFIWVPEISGSTAYMFKYPDLQDKLIAALNFDMTGANPKTTDSYLRIKMTPDSRPSYLNDLLANLLQFVDQTDVRTQTGANAQFNYRLATVATITSGSDHSVFINGGIPAMQFNYWPDNFYHSSGDTAEHADPTEMKRVGFTAAAAFYYLATAGQEEARNLAWESAANGQKWIAEVARQSVRLLGDDPAKLHEQHKAAATKVTGAFNRALGGVRSVTRLSDAPAVRQAIESLAATLESVRDVNLSAVESVYRERCAALGTKPVPITLTEAEREQSQYVPRRLFAVYSAEAEKQSAQRGSGGRGAGAGGRGAGPGGGQPAARPARLPGLANSEITNFIDGKRSVLDIYNAVRAECGNLVVGSNDTKYAFLLSPDAPDITLEQVVAALRALEASGTIEIVKK